MATRGTYQVNEFLLYNHWDNYPEGTAQHFCEVIKKCNNLDAFSIIRGMERTEQTNNIFDGRAEYHYKIDTKNKMIYCYSIPYDKDILILHSFDTYERWINNTIKGNLDSNDNPEDYTIIKTHDNYYCTLAQLRETIQQNYKRAKELTEAGHIGNATSLFSDLFKLINKSGANFDEIKAEYLEKYVPIFVESYNHSDNTLFAGYVNNK